MRGEAGKGTWDKGHIRNNFPVCPASGRIAALLLVCVDTYAVLGASPRQPPYPASRLSRSNRDVILYTFLKAACLCLLIVFMLDASGKACCDFGAAHSGANHPTGSPYIAKQEKTETAPDHYYAIKKDGEYGYEQITEDDGKESEVFKPLLMVRYTSAKAGKHVVHFKDGTMQGTAVCTADCQFVAIKVYSDERLVAVKTIRVTNDPLIYAIMHDVVNGKLKLYRPIASEK